MQGAGLTPAATIIVPTLSRASTLSYSIQSALDQTVQNIEVIVVGDGCSEGCRSIANDFASRDTRVVFLDLPKAPFHGAANRDIAVRQCRSDFVFYNDDDDLLLPHHVEALLEALKSSDIVDTPVVSLAPDGHADLALHDSADPLQRSLLASGELKMVFDTHLAHSKQAYTRLDGPWRKAKDSRPVLHMLTAFAKSQASWSSLQRITALSFHGMRRVTMSDGDRSEELARWYAAIHSEDLERRLRRDGSYTFHCQNLARGFFQAGRTHEETLLFLTDLLGIASAPESASARQLAEVDAVTRFVAGKDISHHDATGILTALLKAGLGPNLLSLETINALKMHVHVNQFLAGFQGSGTSEVWARIAMLMPGSIRDPSLQAEAERAFTRAPSVSKYSFAVAIAHAADEAGEVKIAWRWTDRAVPLAPDSHLASRLWSLRMKLARTLGYAKKYSLAQERLAAAREHFK